MINVLLQLPSNAIVCSNNEPLTSIYYMEIDVANGDTKRVIEKQIHF